MAVPDNSTAAAKDRSAVDFSAGTGTRTIFPVILSVPEICRYLKGREKVVFLSRHARQAVEISAVKTGVVLPELPKNADGAPIPYQGIYWSLSHKSQYAAGVVARSPVGIDIETIRPCSRALFDRIAGRDEWDLAGELSFAVFFRFWTAKEAVLKAAGDGIKGLSRCRISRILDGNHLTVDYADRIWRVEHRIHNGHMAAVVVGNDAASDWTIVDG